MTNPYTTPEASVTGGLVNCVGCSKPIHVTAASCPQCGASQRTRSYKSKVTTALLAFFLGGIGIHRFYLGQWWGLIYILFYLTGIPSLVSFVECIVFLASDKTRWDERYNEGRPAGPGEGSGVGVVIGLVLGVVFFVAFIGILAAVALPAYQDYTVRAKVASALNEADAIKLKVEDFYLQNHMMPESNIMIGLKEPYITTIGSTINVSSDGIELEFSNIYESIEGNTLLFTPAVDGEAIVWSCTGGSLKPKYRPSVCRPPR